MILRGVVILLHAERSVQDEWYEGFFHSKAICCLTSLRLKELADKEQDVDKKMGLRKVFRSLQGVNEEVKRYNGVLKKCADARDDEWEAIVAVHRGDLQKAFFEHLQVRVGDTNDLI